MDASKTRLIRILLVAGAGLLACGVKLWLDFHSEPAVIYSNRPSLESEEIISAAEPGISSGNASEQSSVAGTSDSAAAETTETEAIPVYLCGAISESGIYEVMPGSYLYEAVAMAGGLLPNAAAEHLNLVFRIEEPVSVYIPDQSELEAFLEDGGGSYSGFLRNGLLQGIWGMEGAGSADSSGESGGNAGDTAPININTADLSELETLPGVGESTARAIITYREKNGTFTKIEDIMNVAGIKAGRFEAIRQFITV